MLSMTAPSNAQQLRLTPDDIASRANVGAGAGTSGVSGIRSTILSGDPGGPGPYTIMPTVPPNTRIAAHSHRDARSAIVFSGIWYFGYGETARDDLMRSLPPGSFYYRTPWRSTFCANGCRRCHRLHFRLWPDRHALCRNRRRARSCEGAVAMSAPDMAGRVALITGGVTGRVGRTPRCHPFRESAPSHQLPASQHHSRQ